MAEIRREVDSDKSLENLHKKLYNDSFKYKIIKILASYMISFAELEIKKSKKSIEISKLNKIFDLLVEDLILNFESNTSEIFFIASTDHMTSQKKLIYQEEVFKELKSKIENNDFANDLKKFVIQSSDFLIHAFPLSKSKLVKLKNCDWELLQISMKFEKSSIGKNINLNQADVDEISKFLPEEVLEPFLDKEIYSQKMKDLKKNLEELEEISFDVSQLILAIIPVKENEYS